MRNLLRILYVVVLAGVCLAKAAGPKPHVIAFGKVQTVASWLGGPTQKRVELKVRPLYIDGKLKEYTVGPARDITERIFVVQLVVRINDALPQEEKPLWRWQRAGWIAVNRSSGRTSAISLPAFDSAHSVAVWFRDYVAYCGTSDDSSKVYAIVMQLGRRRPLLRQLLQGMAMDDSMEFACPAPIWECEPTRVTFQLSGGQQLTFSIGEHQAELATEAESPEPE